MSDEDAFQAALDANPDDHVTRLVFADWLEEQGDERAEGYRALGIGEYRPYIPFREFGEREGVLYDYAPWFARDGAFSSGVMEIPKSALPADWFDLVKIEGKSFLFAPDHDYRTVGTRKEIEDAVAVAFALLPSARRAELLSPLTLDATTR